MEINNKKFIEIRQRTKCFYDKINKIKCPYLKNDVHFNEEGFGHLLSKSWNRGRSLSEQYTRLKILPKVVEII